jgi:hypothetical protein
MPTVARLKNARSFFFPRGDLPVIASSKLAPIVAGGIVVAAMVSFFAGVAPLVIGCVLVAGVLIFLAFRRTAKRETEVIFAFYVAADEVLRDNERRRYRFEVADVIQAGEKVVGSMPDPPPLSCFALGALYSLIGDHNAVVERLGIAAEEEVLKDSTHVSPSRRLRRYVKRLRQIERAPDRWPKLHAAVNSLERMHQERAARLLAASQQHLKKLIEAYENDAADRSTSSREPATSFASRSLRSISPPPPISEVLNDVYPEEQTS